MNLLSLQNRLEKAMETVGGAIVFMAMALIVANVALRGLFKLGVPGLIELIEMMLPVVVFWGLAAIEAERTHIAFKLVAQKVPLMWRQCFGLFSAILGLAAFGTVTWLLAIDTLWAWQIGDHTAGLVKWPLFFPKLLVTFGGFMFCCRYLTEIVLVGRPSYWRRIREGSVVDVFR
ncbi:MAG: TRAP transporter small permease [Syntrophaceae bacterium]|nr:TRAP transporter small permease [Syntrophaceae bacterium]